MNYDESQQGGGLCIVGCSDLPPRPLKHFYHHISPSYITSVFSIIASSLFTIICTIVCIIIFSIKKFHQRKSIFALSSFPSKKSIKGNPFLHYQVFHQKNPSKENHPMHYPLHNQIFHHNIIILFHQFFHHHQGHI